MKEIVLKFWTEVERQRKVLTLRVITMQSEEKPYLFNLRGIWCIFIEKYFVESESSVDWKDYFQVNVRGGLCLQIYSNKYQINYEIP
jgi:hypothetical protein